MTVKRTYEQKLHNIETWADIVDHYWHLYQGDMFNHEDMWDNTLHAMTDQDWWDWVDIEPALKIQWEQHYRRYPKLSDDTREIYAKLALGKPVTRKGGKHKNLTAFRTLMSIHDLVNDSRGTPTKQYPKNTAKVEESLTPYETLFDV